MVSHVVFDMDGVLYPLTQKINRAFSEAAASAALAMGAELTFEQALDLSEESYQATGSSRSFFARDHDIDEFRMMITMHALMDVDALLTPDPALRDELESLAARGLTFSVLTAADTGYAHRVLDRLRLRDLFKPDQIIGSEQYKGHSKRRNAEPFQLALVRSGHRPEDTAMVEDTAVNLVVPHGMGFRQTVLLYSPDHGKPAWVHEKHHAISPYLRSLSL